MQLTHSAAGAICDVEAISGQIPSTIAKSISDGVSKCSLTRASGASGSRMGTAAPRLNPSIGCLPTTSKSSATVVHPSIQQTANAFAVRTTPARRFKQEPRGWELDEGGRGFNSSERGRFATAHTLMQRFFLVPGVLNFFPGIKNSNSLAAISFDETMLSTFRPRLSGNLFSPRPVPSTIAFQKLSRNSLGGVGHDSIF
jgi:hypothetical protein